MSDTNSRICIIKIASGPMAGQELMVNADNNLIIIGDGLDYKTDINNDGVTTYQIPSNGITCEFSIITASQYTESGIAIRLNNNGLSTEIPIIFQQLLLADIFPIAIKMQDTDWQSPQPLENALMSEVEGSLPATKTTTRNKVRKSATEKSPLFNKQTMLLFFFTLFAIFIFYVIFQYIPDQSAEKKVKTLEHILQGSHYPITVTQNVSNESVILVKTQRDADWSMQRLVKAKYNEKFSIRIINKLEKEIENKIIEVFPDTLKLDISNPCNPTITIIANNISTDTQKKIDKLLSNYFRCYTKSEIKKVILGELLQKAELGLTESNVQWRKITKDNKVIFIIKDSLDDNQTVSLINFTNTFHKQWGENHIQFSISLANNKLLGKSFVTNENGYLLLGNNHWFFNSISF
ncbi:MULTISPECIES: PrgH/EprH family type III secretion apparatus protein [Providencia]|uniref:PrgH/EprH family type III secretion apparatus protein n=1 Tax=Providencia TaxID=586 RepID=UPI001BD4A112|nr:PrgH/EprH family type III secretion apparatus protein [Providencia rettgeri]ELR5074253.1 type III secretion system protein PrgH [Providencia stuartii]ELR5071687.1 type III secretion system protein PrgH [Providencia rettgeri]ELR5222093.1 type III secretion system protein PrgH [Providencia rettgeri]MDX7321924.1 PrgH/EprH family type III secretion apparatus protein [Providencia rettgeri]UPS63113.1 type III secretion system protein PrgH [Providencia rettgeri]